MRRFVLAIAVVGLCLVIMPTKSHAQCAGFTDVTPASQFCPNVEWLKNRGVTLGCTSTTLYCPTDPVTRLSMAAFMNRLGKALSPEVLFREFAPAPGAGSIVLPANPPVDVRCDTVDTAATAYPRTAVVTGTFTGLADANAVAWRGFVVYSTDGGSTWNGTAGGVGLRASSGPGQWSGVDPNGVVDLAPGLAYRFAIGLRRDDQIAGTTGNFTDYRCLMTATVVNRNGTSTPFDAPRAAAHAGL